MNRQTQYWAPERLDSGLIEAASALAAGGVVAFPTETVYGLGGDARSTEAVERIFAAKGRPSDNPLIVHLADAAGLDGLAAGVSSLERKLMAAFWPGPLTFVLPALPGAVSPRVTAGLDTVAVRVPAHETARRLIAAAGCPIAAPSANRSGRPSPTLARHVLDDLDGRIDGVLDGGPTGVGLESTVVRVMGDVVHVLRPGGVTAEQLRAAAGPDVRVESGSGDVGDVGEAAREVAPSGDAGAAGADDGSAAETAPRSPGVKYTHYAPQGEMVLVTGDAAPMRATVQSAADAARARGLSVGILACAEHAGDYRADAVLVLGSRAEPGEAAQTLYAALRECDDRGLGYIVAEGYPEDGIGAALMNRLRKAAGGHVLQA
ncbi:L-threonylcarbamoyladenylate synthase [Cohnella nanjingensis]|uniref:Threonylcarbamoyl-AMP synthase n=1 Tax=Cohnella nanjingensis TaxID=1387779 RepID=A0A7X0RLW1_9BACL|nr:L-threonylcarbamoyladenylate synthase [Cohnella nanjingensis]MBB6669929.1 threonylcarbamoyl-AMP synthase [Cohnella nanjingensis]